MNFNNYTVKAQEVIQKAAELASGNGQQAIEPGHILKAIMSEEENITSFLFKKLNIDRNKLDIGLQELINSYVRASGGNSYLSGDTAAALQKAESYLKEFKDDFIAVEHILLGIVAGKDKAAVLM